MIMGKVSLRIAFFVLACALFGGCTTVTNCVRGLFGGPKEEESLPVYDGDDPRIRPGVILVVSVSSVAQAPKAMTVQVDPNGSVVIPYLLQDPVYCKDLSLDAFKQKLLKSYQEYIRQPQVSVTFGPYDERGVSPWGYVTVLGEVGSPGPVNMPPTRDLTVTKVIKQAGGFKPFANKSRVKVSSCDRDGNRTRTIVDVDEIGEKGRPDKDITLKSGDVVWVPEAWY